MFLAARAAVEVARSTGSRSLPVAELFVGFMETAIDEHEIITRVTIPPRAGWRSAYTRFTPGSDDDYPTVAVAVSLQVIDAEIVDAEIALGGVDSTAIRVPDAAAVLIGGRGGEQEARAAARLAAAACSPSDDQRGSARYKTAMVELWTRRTIEHLVATA